MTLALGILLGLVAFICLVGGMNIMLKGAMYFLPKDITSQPVLDDLVRFLAGIYLGGSFLFAYATFHVNELGNIIYCLGIMIVFSGLGRLYSRLKLGTAGRYFDIIMLVEILLGILIIILNGVR